MRRRTVALLLAVALASLVPGRPMRADEGNAEPPAPVPAELYEQTDRKKMMTMKLPRTWKAEGGENVDPKAVASFVGFFGEPEKSPPGKVAFYVQSDFGRCGLARAVNLPLVGTIKPASMRQGPGWAEGCAVDERQIAQWRRYVEKNNRVYMFLVFAHGANYDIVRPTIEKLLDTCTVPGEFTAPAMGQNLTQRKGGDFDLWSDATADQESILKKASGFVAAGRDVVSKLLPGKPFDPGKPALWIYKNGANFDERAKATLGAPPEFSAFNPTDRCVMLQTLSFDRQGGDQSACHSGARQYVWQYFGGSVPMWLDIGLATYGQLMAASGSKGKLAPEVLAKARTSAGANKRRLDQWFDVASSTEISDNDQAANELFAWQWFFRFGKGSRKYKKQFDGYIASLRETGDPVAARKSFDGVNFDEMQQEFKAWVADWK